MAVEIKELVIRAVVDPDRAQQSIDGEPTTSRVPADETQRLVEASVREVLRFLRRSKER